MIKIFLSFITYFRIFTINRKCLMLNKKFIVSKKKYKIIQKINVDVLKFSFNY
jgi:hypothetical protein